MPSLGALSPLSGPITAAVPVFPTPSSSPTGLIVGNGGVVGTASQLLGSSTNSLFAGGNGYVTNGSLQVSTANFSQGYSVVNVLGVGPTLTLDPAGTLLTSTSGAVVGGTGVNSHLTLLGGVTSNSYIYNINNGQPNGVLGLVLPNSAPAFASTCLNALVVNVACYGINAAQDYQVLVGDGASANGSKEVVIGTNASHTLPQVNANVAFPGNGTNDPNNPTGVPTADYEARLGHSVVIGDSASGTANAQTILGAEATANAANSVALGYQSVANRGGQANYSAFGLSALQNSAGEVSIGSPGAERQITNVAAGSSATDAVNLGQLESVASNVTSDSVQYDNAGKTSITLGGTPSVDGGVTNGTTLTNLHQGSLSATSTDAVNGAQLYATNSTVSNIYDTTSKFFQANSAGIGSNAAGIDSLAAGPSAVATGNASIALGSGATTAIGSNNAIAIGTGAGATFANSVALGSGSLTTFGALANYNALGLSALQNSAGEVSVGAVGAERQITNVAAGSAPTDAVNVAQLSGVAADASNSVQYDNVGKTSITLGGTTSVDGGVTNGTTLTNLHQGALSATSTDAVNGAQLYATNSTVSNIYDTTSKFFQANSAGIGSNAAGIDSLAAGPSAVSTGNASIALGSGATTAIGSNNAIAIGTGAGATFANSVALGSGSLTTFGALANYNALGLSALQNSAGEVSVGAVGAERQITNVAAGSAPTDAVNVAQLSGVAADASNSVQYDNASKTSITLGGTPSVDGGVTNGTTLTNLHQGALSATSTDAVNGAQLYATNSTISNIYDTTSKFFQANSVGIGSNAAGTDSLAAGPSAVATGSASIALGSGATTAIGSNNSIALGTGAGATFANSVALGSGSLTTVGAQTNYSAFGLIGPQNSAGEVSVGAVGAERQITNVAAGNAPTDAVNLAQLQGVATTAEGAVQYDNPTKTSITLAGPVSTDGGVTNGTRITNVQQGALSATSTDAVNGAQLYATNSTVSNIYDTTSKFFQANSLGIGSNAAGTDSIAAGPAAAAAGVSSIAVGSGAAASATNAIALGTGANSNFANSIALGAGSVTTVGALTGYTAYGLVGPQASSGELNVGNRQITGLAPGLAATDAVNVAQLQGVSADAANSVQYDNSAHTSVTLGGLMSTDGGMTNGTTLTNLHQGMLSATSTDAVNGAQLWHATEDTSNQYSTYSLYNDINNTAGTKYFSVDSTLPGSSATGLNAAAAGPNAKAAGVDSFAMGNGATAQGNYSLAVSDNTLAAGTNSIAVGSGATTNFDNSVALGAGSVTTVGALTNYSAYGLAAPQTSAGELAVGNRQITGVAAGSAPNDAVNLAQLEAVSAAGGGGMASKLSVLYDADASGNPTNTITLTGTGSGTPVSITNLAAGAETATSSDAVNGSQLWHWTQDASNQYSNLSLFNDITSLNQAGGGNNKYEQVNSTLGGAVAGGTNSVAIGPVASAGGTNSVAVGNGASAAANNSVALGAGSVANRDNTVSVGSAGSERQITNVAAGTSDTDAANVGQVNSGVQQAENWATSYTDQRFGALSNQIQQIGNRANAGVAAAMAMAGLPQAYEPGKSMAAVAAGTFRSESSIAVGVSTISEGGRWVYKMTGSVDTRGDGGISIGAGMQW